jgi:ABC-type enterochelin transport system permease subunit
MPDMFDKVRGVLASIVGIVLVLIPLAVAAQILVGGNLPFVGSVVDNLILLVDQLGDAGLVGLIVLGIILYLFRGMAR